MTVINIITDSYNRHVTLKALGPTFIIKAQRFTLLIDKLLDIIFLETTNKNVGSTAKV